MAVLDAVVHFGDNEAMDQRLRAGWTVLSVSDAYAQVPVASIVVAGMTSPTCQWCACAEQERREITERSERNEEEEEGGGEGSESQVERGTDIDSVRAAD